MQFYFTLIVVYHWFICFILKALGLLNCTRSNLASTVQLVQNVRTTCTCSFLHVPFLLWLVVLVCLKYKIAFSPSADQMTFLCSLICRLCSNSCSYFIPYFNSYLSVGKTSKIPFSKAKTSFHSYCFLPGNHL